MRYRTVLIAVPLVVVLVGLGCQGLRLMTSDEGALPPASHTPDVPAGASVVAETVSCGSGGCWRHLSVTPAAGTTPADLAREMGLDQERCTGRTLIEPRKVCVSATAGEERLEVYVGYQ